MVLNGIRIGAVVFNLPTVLVADIFIEIRHWLAQSLVNALYPSSQREYGRPPPGGGRERESGTVPGLPLAFRGGLGIG